MLAPPAGPGRLKLLRVRLDALPAILSAGRFEVQSEIPIPAHVDRWAIEGRTLTLTLTSPEFPEVPEGEPVPELGAPVFARLYGAVLGIPVTLDA